MASRFTLLLCFSLAIVAVSGLKCPTCLTVRCASPESLNCPYGAVERQCGCCFECRKGVGEECGGPKNILGTCAIGLICDTGKTRRQGYCRAY
ncbi:single insulin-like growth factor-binding domain protein-2 [Macrobrachium rosenbergii]|uniref:Single insulin-binding domain protein n=1 Tax=Macrobrachium rosenbergii TaxID=79674 RepID=A0A5K5D8K4_MACRS|nr:single insulin-binding domain protein [Macrobrachium rosenbergii]